jgi:hypothetical protein
VGQYEVKMAVLRLRSGLLKRFSSEKPNTSIVTEDIASGDTIHPRRSKRLRDPTSSEPKNTAKVEDSIHLRLRKRRPDPTIKVNTPHPSEIPVV